MNHNHLSSAETPASPADLPTTSPDHTCQSYLREINRLGRMGDVRDFLLDTASREFHEFTDPNDLDAFENAYSEFIAPSLTAADASALKDYTGIGHKVINQVSRDMWDYDILGAKTPERVAEARHAITAISAAIEHLPSPGVDLAAYRGTNLDSFRSYGIDSLTDLTRLEGEFFLETGFTSTSLSENQSFADRDFDDPLRRHCDISVTYRIPKEARETVGLFTHDLAYNPEQSELLIDNYSLFYISAVDIADDHTKAALEMTLIPRDLYDYPPNTDAN